MKKYNMITPEGTKDLLFQECIVRRRAEEKLKAVFSARGYREVITPGIEYYDVFDMDGTAIPQYEMYKSSDNKGRLLVFRPDLTLPIARLAATRLKSHKGPMRLYYNQPVYRNRKDLSGRSDEECQAGIELMGIGGLRADLEAIVVAVEALGACGLNFRLEIGHAGLFSIFADKLEISEEHREDIRTTIESKNYAALSGLLESVPPSVYREAMMNLPRLFGGAEVLEKVEAYCVDPEAREIIGYLKELYRCLVKLGLGDRLMVDLGLVQRNHYYTGVVFSAYVEGHGASVLTGGRYDRLLEKFQSPMPAVGFGVDVDAVSGFLIRDEEPAIPQVIVYGGRGREMEAQLKLNLLAAEGIVCESSLFSTGEETLSYAKEKGIAKVIILDETEEEVLL